MPMLNGDRTIFINCKLIIERCSLNLAWTKKSLSPKNDERPIWFQRLV